MMLKASIAVITLAIGMSAEAPARAETGCPAAHRTAHHPARRAATRTVIVEEHYSHAPRAPAPPYYDGPAAPPEAYAPPPADIAYGAPDDYYEPILTSYGYGYGGYGGFGGYGRPRSGWYSHVGGGARWGGAGVAGPTVVRGASGFVRVRPGVVHVGPSIVRPSGSFGAARVGGQAMAGGGGRR